jgi:dGTPase
MPTAGPPSAIFDREAALLAPFAMHSARSRGRKYPEAPHPYRGPYQRDRDRIIHCAAFRRLSQKTQVFTGHDLGDYHRSRLTHTLEVSSISRTLARALRLNEDLAEALSLAHDLGHPPFGHAGEDTLNECLADCGGFNHNRQGLRIVDELEQRYPTFQGLNLSLEVLESQHDRVTKTGRTVSGGTVQPLLEAQIVDAADSIAYDSHDPDDALAVGLLEFDELLQTGLWNEAVRRVRSRHAGLSRGEERRAAVHELVDWQVSDLLAETSRRIAEHAVDSVEAVRRAPPLAAASDSLRQMQRELEKFLYQRVYRHPRLLAVRDRAQAKLRQMFEGYVGRPELLPENFRARIDKHGLARTVGDYLAGMTDRFAEQEHSRLFSQSGR